MKNRTFALLMAGGLAGGTSAIAAGFSYSFDASGQTASGVIPTPAGSTRIKVFGRFQASALVSADASNPTPADFTVTFQDVALELKNLGFASSNTRFVDPSSPWTIELGTLGTVTAIAHSVVPGGTGEAVFDISVTAFSFLGTLKPQGTYQVMATFAESPTLSVSAGKNGTFAGWVSPTFTGTVTIVPEPAEVGMLAGLGLLSFGLWRTRQKGSVTSRQPGEGHR